MPVLSIEALTQILGAATPLTSGRIRIEYRDAHGPAVIVDGAAVTIFRTIDIPIRDGEPVEPVDVPATDGRMYARITVEDEHGKQIWQAPSVAIPHDASTLADLVPVNPNTFEPTPQTTAAWLAAIAEVKQIRDDMIARSVRFYTIPGNADLVEAVFPEELLGDDGISLKIQVEER